MAADASAAARVYQAIKARILDGRLRVGARLDVERLAADLSVSATPVRQALAQISFDGLVVVHPLKGFQVALWSERELAALYQWRGQLLRLTLEQPKVPERAPPGQASALYADWVETVFRSFDPGTNNNLSRAAHNADERLRAARMAEPDLLSGAVDEIGAIANTFARGDQIKTRALARRYHLRRVRIAGQIRARVVVRALPSNGP